METEDGDTGRFQSHHPHLLPPLFLSLSFNREACLTGTGYLVLSHEENTMELYLAEFWAVVFLLNTWGLRKAQ